MMNVSNEQTVMQHTPGPWVYKRHEKHGDVDHIATVAWCSDYCIGKDCGTAASRNYESHGTDEADARLIAAAPDLLNALRSLLRHVERVQELMAEECGAWFCDDGPTSMARHALRLAVGADGAEETR
jgi:hypothetical protein